MDPERLDSDALLGQWDDWMAACGLSERTREMYYYSVLKLRGRPWCRGKPLVELTDSDIFAHLAAFGSKAHSKVLHGHGVRSFYGFAHDLGLIERDPTALLRGRTPRRSPPAPYSPSELAQLLEAARAREPRRAAAMLCCYGLGLRRMELVSLRVNEIDWEHRVVHLSTTKGNRPRDVPIGPLAEGAIRELLPQATERLLPIEAQTFTMWVNRAARDCGFPPGRKRRAHTLRATFATDLERAGVRASVIQALLGHESLASTMIYLGTAAADASDAVTRLGRDGF